MLNRRKVRQKKLVWASSCRVLKKDLVWTLATWIVVDETYLLYSLSILPSWKCQTLLLYYSIHTTSKCRMAPTRLDGTTHSRVWYKKSKHIDSTSMWIHKKIGAALWKWETNFSNWSQILTLSPYVNFWSEPFHDM